MNIFGKLLWLIVVRVIIGFPGAFLRKFYFKLIGTEKSIGDLLSENKNNMLKSEEFKSVIIGLISWSLLIYSVIIIVNKLKN